MLKTNQGRPNKPPCPYGAEYAVRLGMEGYTCSESVVMAFANHVGLSPETAARIAGGFAGGMAQGKTCGAVTGAIMIIGMKYGEGRRRDPYHRDHCYQMTQEFSHRFMNLRKSLECSDILMMNGIDPRNPEEMKALREKKLCGQIIFDAAGILESLIEEEV
jgi:C_GCAxxG_C_C family probable redox protein